MRLHNYEILQRKMMDRIIELESGRSFLEFNQDKIVTRIEWLERDQLIDQEEKSEPESSKVDVTRMQAKIGELTLENDFFERALTKAGLLSAKR